MRNGDISNKVSSCNIGIRLNDFLVDFNRQSIFQKLRYYLVGKIGSRAIDPSVLRFVENIFYRTSCTVDLVYVGKSVEKKFIDAVQYVPHNRIHLTEDLYGVESLLYSGVLSYFVSTPMDVEWTNGEYAYTLEQFNSLLKKGLK